MKVNTEKIAGYSEMSVEEKLAALEAYEFEDSSKENAKAELERLKSALSKSNAEAADYKRQLRAKLTDDEAKAAQDAEEREAMVKELEGLRKEKAISGYKASYLSIGYDEEVAEANAKALHSGDFNTVFENQKKFIEAQRKAAAANALDKQPGLTIGEPITPKDAGDISVSAFRKAAGLN